MKRLIAGIVATGFYSASSLAADLPRKAPPPVVAAPVYAWTGCYIGGNVGYGWSKNNVVDVTVVPPFDTGSDTGTGIVGGGQIGCDYQFANNWVVGIQGMFDWSGVEGDHPYIGGAGSIAERLGTKTRWFATLTGRIGYAVIPQALVYFKGGVAWIRNRYSDADPIVLPNGYSGHADATRSGWTIGGGAEYSLQRNWSVFVEYDYIDIGSQNTTLTYTICQIPPCGPYTYRQKNSLQTILLGVNYRFGGTGY
jgi:outer membrane immunogenic protein